MNKPFNAFLLLLVALLTVISCQRTRNNTSQFANLDDAHAYIADIRGADATEESRAIRALLRAEGIHRISSEANLGIECVVVKKADAVKAVNAISEEFEIGPQGRVELPDETIIAIKAPFLQLMKRDYSAPYEGKRPPRFRVIPKFDEAKIVQVIDQITRCPSWIHLKPDAVKERQRVLECIASLMQEDNTVLRESIRRFSKSKIANGTYSAEDQGTLFLITRFIFNTPTRWGTRDLPPGGALEGQDSEYVNLLSPLSVAADGSLMLTGTFPQKVGRPPNAVEDFDWFAKHFARRSTK